MYVCTYVYGCMCMYLKALIAEVDLAGNGQIDYSEFLAMFMRNDVKQTKKRMSVVSIPGRPIASPLPSPTKPSQPQNFNNSQSPTQAGLGVITEQTGVGTGDSLDIRALIEGGNALEEAEKLFLRNNLNEMKETRGQLIEIQTELAQQIRDLQARAESVHRFIAQIDEVVVPEATSAQETKSKSN